MHIMMCTAVLPILNQVQETKIEQDILERVEREQDFWQKMANSFSKKPKIIAGATASVAAAGKLSQKKSKRKELLTNRLKFLYNNYRYLHKIHWYY